MIALVRGRQFRRVRLTSFEKTGDGQVTVYGDDGDRETAFIFSTLEWRAIDSMVKKAVSGRRGNFKEIFRKLLDNGAVTP